MTKRLNLRFALILTCSGVVFGTGTHFLHAYQVRRTSGGMLDRATELESEGHVDSAAEYLGRYLSLNPDATPVQARYGILLADKRLATSPKAQLRAWLVLNKVLYRDPDRLDVRRLVARLATDLGYYADARTDIEKYLLPKFPDDGELQKLLGRCHEAVGRFREARQAYKESINKAPHDLQGYDLLANLLRNHKEDALGPKENTGPLEQANAVMDQMVESNAQSAQAYLRRANDRRVRNGFARDAVAQQAASKDIARARELAPDDADVILAAAHDLPREKAEDARKLLRHGYELQPPDWRFYVQAARLEMDLGQNDAALACVREGLKRLPRQPELLWEIADLLTAVGPPEEAKEAVHRLELEYVRPQYLSCLRARLSVRAGPLKDAIVELESAYADLIGLTGQTGHELTETLAQQTGLSLGRCLEQTGDTDRAFEAYRRVVARNDGSVAGRLGMARTQAAQGQLPAALIQYRQLMQLPGAPTEGWVEIARLALLCNLQGDGHNWQEMDGALNRAENEMKPPPPTVAVLRSKFWSVQPESIFPDHYARARTALLENYGDPKARPAEIWVELADLEVRQKRPEKGLAVLDEAQQHLGDAVEIRLARVRFWRRGHDQVAGGLGPLIQGLDKFTTDQRRQLIPELAVACRQAGLTADARRLWEQLAKEQEKDLGSRIALYDLAVSANDKAGMEEWQGKIKDIEGDDGVMWKFARASALVGRADQGDKGGLAEARRLLSEIKLRRPNWSRVVLREAQLNDLEGAFDTSLSLYLKALEMGEQDPRAFERTLKLLYAQRRDSEATALLRRLPKDSLLAPSTQRVAADIALRSQDWDQALARAERAVAVDSKDYKDHLWLGILYWKTGHRNKAEPALLRARELAPSAPEVWLARVQFFVQTGHNDDKALAEVELARRKLTTPAAAATLATCHELVGQTDRAREIYQTAIKAAPDDSAVLRAAAEFYIRTGQPQPAQELLVRLSGNANSAAAAWARRARAVLLVAEGNSAKVQEALTLLGGPVKDADSPDGVLDRRIRAQLFVLQNTVESRRDALTILDALIARQAAIPADQLLAAELYEAANDWPRARQRYLGVVDQRSAANPQALAAAARSLIRHGEADGAAQALAALEATAPTGAAVKEIKARLLHIEGRTGDAVALVREWAKAGGVEQQAAAAVMEEFGDFPAAEELYRGFVARSQRPQDALVLASFLIRRQQFAEALDICDRCWATCPPSDVAQICLFALSKPSHDAAQLRRVSHHLEVAIARFPNDVNLLAAQAAVFNFQGRFDEAVAVYRRILEKEPRHGTALNNLAWLLALQGSHGEDAVILVNKATQTIGLVPSLLDTRAVAFLSIGGQDHVRWAVNDLEMTVAKAPSPTAYFHLARAYELVGRHQDAKEAWKKARDRGLTVESVHQLEKPNYEKLATALN